MASEQSIEKTQSSRSNRTAFLRKQSEIEEVEEEDTSPGSDQSDTTITAGTDTPRVTEGESPEAISPDDLKSTSPTSHKLNHISPKIKQLTRGEALCEECASPPLDPLQSTASTCSTDSNSSGIGTKSMTSGSLSGSSFRGRLEKDGSQSSEAGTSSSLSRDSSVDTPYKDSTGIDLEDFIKKTLNKTPKDRSMLIKLEVDLIKFIREPKHHYLKFPQMSSYDRMLVHRIAAFFGLDHNVDQTGKCVIVNKTQSTRVPDFSFQEHISNGGESKPKMLLKRGGGGSFDENQSRSLQKPTLDSTRAAKSLEERKQQYEEARSRIFTGEEQMDGQPTGYAQEDPSVTGIVKKLNRPQSLGSSKDDHTWSSTESSGYGTDNSTRTRIIPGIPKANSFGGTGTFVWKSPMLGGSLSKADSINMGVGMMQPNMSSPLVRPIMMSSPTCGQSDSSSISGSNSSGLAPSPQQTNTGLVGGPGGQKFYWVASDLNSIPPGSVVINPQTGQPYANADGSAYRYTPGQPLPQPGPNYPPSPQPQMYSVQTQQQDWTSQTSQDSQTSADVCQQLSMMRVTPQSSIDSNCAAGDTTAVPQQHVLVNQNVQHQQTFSQQQPVPGSQQQAVYFPGMPSVPGQSSVRYVCPMNYGTPSATGSNQQCYRTVQQGLPVEGQHYPAGQYCQQYVPQGNYSGSQMYPVTSQGQIVGGQGQNCEVTYQCGYSVTSPVEGQGAGIGAGYNNYSVAYNQQPTVAAPNQSQIYYTVQNPQSNQPQVQGYTFNGQQGTTYQTNTTPPSQNSNVTVNPSVQLNNLTAQQQPVNMNNLGSANPVNIPQQQAPGATHGLGTAVTPGNVGQAQSLSQYISYPSSHHIMAHNQQQYPTHPHTLTNPAVRPVVTPQVVPLPSVPLHSQVPAPHTFHAMYRPNMQMPMQIHQHQVAQQQQQPAVVATKSPHPPTQHGHVTVSAKSVSYESGQGQQGKLENGSGENADVALPGVVTDAQVVTSSMYRPQNPGEIRLQYQPQYRPQVQSVQLTQQSPQQHSLTKSPTAPKPQRIKKSRSRDSQQSQQSTDKGMVTSNILEVCDLPSELRRSDVDKMLHKLLTAGAQLQFLTGDKDGNQGDFNSNNQTISQHARVFAVFQDTGTAAHVLNTHCNNSAYRLKPTDSGSISESQA